MLEVFIKILLSRSINDWRKFQDNLNGIIFTLYDAMRHENVPRIKAGAYLIINTILSNVVPNLSYIMFTPDGEIILEELKGRVQSWISEQESADSKSHIAANRIYTYINKIEEWRQKN